MNAQEIKELIEVTKMLSYLEGFIDGHGGEEHHYPKLPFELSTIEEVKALHEKTDNHHTSLVNKFKTK